jgi:hypothetical protein
MKPRPLHFFVLAALLLASGFAPDAAARSDSATVLALKKVTNRYALTKIRIATLLDQRMHPTPLPDTLPNPFYHPLELAPSDTASGPAEVVVVVPAAPDISDADTLAKFAATLKVSGVVVLNGQPHLTINQALCRVGDVIPAGSKEHPIYIQVLRITPEEFTLGLNQAEQTIRLKK